MVTSEQHSARLVRETEVPRRVPRSVQYEDVPAGVRYLGAISKVNVRRDTRKPGSYLGGVVREPSELRLGTPEASQPLGHLLKISVPRLLVWRDVGQFG